MLQTPKQGTTIFQTKLSLEKSCSMSTQSSLHSLVSVKPRDPPSKASNGLCGCVGVLHVRSSSLIRLNEMRPILGFGHADCVVGCMPWGQQFVKAPPPLETLATVIFQKS